MRVLACGAWDEGAGYPRAMSLFAGLAAANLEFARCRVPMPGSGRDKQRLAGAPWRWPGLALALAARRSLFLARARAAIAAHRPDVVLVPYPGHLVAPWLRRVFRGPLVLDLFLSAYDTAVVDRGLHRPGSLAARLLRGLDRRACAVADRILLDTPEHAIAIAQQLGLAPARTAWVPISDPEAPVVPFAYTPPRADQGLEVLFFGTGVPLHGLGHLVAAIAQVPRARLTLIGGTAADRCLAEQRLGPRLRLEPEFVARAELSQHLARCDLVAGVFGAGPKAQRVVPFKVVHALAAGRPVLTADSPAIRRFCADGHDVFTCRAADPAAIATTLEQLLQQPSQLRLVAANARAAYDRAFSAAAVAARLRAVLEEVVGAAGPPSHRRRAPVRALSAGRAHGANAASAGLAQTR